LFLDYIEIVKQPFGRWNRGLIIFICCRENAADIEQGLCGCFKLFGKSIFILTSGYNMLLCQKYGMDLKCCTLR